MNRQHVASWKALRCRENEMHIHMYTLHMHIVFSHGFMKLGVMKFWVFKEAWTIGQRV